MQRFTLLHDGSYQGWQATYLAFHVAARLGAPLQVLHIGLGSEAKALYERATQVEIGGRAAEVTMDTRLLVDFSVDTLKKSIETTNGLFLPLRLVPDERSVVPILEAFQCPLWIISKDSEIKEMAVLIGNPVRDAHLLSFTKTLSHRLQQSITVLAMKDSTDSVLKTDLSELEWKPLPGFSHADIALTIEQLNVGLLFVSASDATVVGNLPVNYVICPNVQGT